MMEMMVLMHDNHGHKLYNVARRKEFVDSDIDDSYNVYFNKNFAAMIQCDGYGYCNVEIINSQFIDNVGYWSQQNLITYNAIISESSAYGSLVIKDSCFEGGYTVWYQNIKYLCENSSNRSLNNNESIVTNNVIHVDNRIKSIINDYMSVIETLKMENISLKQENNRLINEYSSLKEKYDFFRENNNSNDGGDKQVSYLQDELQKLETSYNDLQAKYNDLQSHKDMEIMKLNRENIDLTNQITFLKENETCI